MDCWVDFNSMDPDGLVFAAAPDGVQVGDRITMGDCEGVTAKATVVRMGKGFLEAIVDVDTIAEP